MKIKINNDNINIRTGGYQINNDNPYFLLIHGAGMDASVWQMQTRYLANRGVNVLAIDLPGHGLSEGKSLSSISEMSEWTIQLINKLDIDSISIAGHSMGSLVAIDVCKNISKKINNITFKDINLQDVDLSKNKGKIMVLNFWATWCAPCKKEMPSLEKLAQNLPQVDVYPINMEPPNKLRVRDWLQDIGVVSLNTYFDPKLELRVVRKA